MRGESTGILQKIRSRSEILAGALFISVWLAASVKLFRAEAAGYRAMPELYRHTLEEKKAAVSGSIYMLASKAAGVVPEDGKIYFLNPNAGNSASYYLLKTRYYLYPRNIKDARKFNAGDLAESDYLVVFISRTARETYDLDGLPVLEKVYDYTYADGYGAIYRILKG